MSFKVLGGRCWIIIEISLRVFKNYVDVEKIFQKILRRKSNWLRSLLRDRGHDIYNNILKPLNNEELIILEPIKSVIYLIK